MNSNKNILGLTGLYCSGKSTIESILKNKYNFIVIDIDKIGYQILEKKKKEIIKIFGKNILTNKEIDRKKLGSIVFSQKKKLRTLNSIVHPSMVKNIKDQVKQLNTKNICINAALLFDMKLDKICTKILIVRTPIFSIFKRAKTRDNYSLIRILKIIFSQKKLLYINKKHYNADIFFIYNGKDLNNLENQIKVLFKKRN